MAHSLQLQISFKRCNFSTTANASIYINVQPVQLTLEKRYPASGMLMLMKLLQLPISWCLQKTNPFNGRVWINVLSCWELMSLRLRARIVRSSQNLIPTVERQSRERERERKRFRMSRPLIPQMLCLQIMELRLSCDSRHSFPPMHHTKLIVKLKLHWLLLWYNYLYLHNYLYWPLELWYLT